ncbi:hypothetical protein ACHAWF_010489 [Thalassiosira exigua]
MNDDKVIFYTTGSSSNKWLECSTEYIDWTHPTALGHEKFSARLYETMRSDVCQHFPSKCGSPTSNPVPTLKPTLPMPSFNYNADHGEDSRLVAFVGNWQSCPTNEQIDAYSHLVISFSVSYAWSPSANNCDTECNIAPTVPTCENTNRQDLVDSWRAAGKKVLLSFGGAGMGGSWSGDPNNCWDYCFGKEDQLSDDLVNIIDKQNFDGIDIDYEYCYDIAGKQAGRCGQRTYLYSDEKAQTFLGTLTSNLRNKLDALQLSNGTPAAPMDSDMTPSSSAYFQILRNRRADIDFLMPQFYNGVTRPAVDGVNSSGVGSMSAATIFESLSNDLFDMEPNKPRGIMQVVFGHCVSDCSGTGSNVNAAQAVQITSDLKSINNAAFACNGGAFFWVAEHDYSGSWSDAVVAEVSKTAGCSDTEGTSAPNPAPSRKPSESPIAGTTHCGCPECTDAIWNTLACSGSECYTCGSRILFKQSLQGGALSPAGELTSRVCAHQSYVTAPLAETTYRLRYAEACAFVSEEILDGPCGPVCNPEMCNGSTKIPTSSPTSSPTSLPTKTSTRFPTTMPSKSPTPSPTNQITPDPTFATPTPPPTAANPPPAPGPISCTAVAQSELPEGTWATSDQNCEPCGDGQTWWPCDTEPALCTCTSSTECAENWGPCGGTSFEDRDCCDGWICTSYDDDYYRQCLPP